MLRRLMQSLAMLLVATSGYAQDSAAADPQAQAVSPQAAPESDGGFVAKARRYVEEKRLLEKLGLDGHGDGFYVRFGDMTTGSGIAAGPGYRTGLFNDRLFLDLSAGISTKTYRAVDAKARWLRAFDDRLEFWTDVRYQNFPQEDYFGMGVATPLDMRANYALESTDISTRGVFTPRPWLHVGGRIGFFNPSIGEGTDDNYPSIEARFTDLTAPGLDAQPNFLHTTVSMEVDYRDRPGSPGAGGLYRASYGAWNDVTLHAFDFHRFDADAGQFFTVVPRHVLAAHIGVSYVNNETGHRVPFYFLPYVGGSDTLRGYREFRFRDENILFANAEYRWQMLEPLDVALFFDAGEVRADWEDIDFSELRTSYGFGVRVHTAKRTFLRFDVGTSGQEGWRFFLKMGPSF